MVTEDSGEMSQEGGGQRVPIPYLEPLGGTREAELLQGETYQLVPVGLKGGKIHNDLCASMLH